MRMLNLVGLSAALACGASAQASVEPLRLCADPTNLPFSSNAPEASAKGAPGLYVEIGQAVSDALGRPMQTVWSQSYFGKRNLRTTLLAKQCDLAVGLPAVDDFMGPRVIFSRPILTLGYSLVVPRDQAVSGIDDLKGKRVIVQFASPPQSQLATREDIASVTAMDPEEAMRRLAAGEADAAFIWGPSASYINHTSLHDAFRVIPIEAPQMQYPAAIGFAKERAELRDQVNAVLAGLAPRIRELSAKYAIVAAGPSATTTDAGPLQVALGEPPPAPVATAAGADGNIVEGKKIFNGTCAHCHGPDAVVADRKIDLRRLKAKYGDQMDEVFLTTVTNGRPTKGMPTWKEVFKQEDFVNILSYLKTVQDN